MNFTVIFRDASGVTRIGTAASDVTHGGQVTFAGIPRYVGASNIIHVVDITR